MMGRRTIYGDDLLAKAKDYVDNCPDVLPSIVGLALHMGISRKTAYLWAEKYEEFSDILDTVMDKQELTLISNGLTGDFNPTITKVILGKHGYSDRTETDITTKGQAVNTWTINPVTTRKDAED